MSGDRAVGVRVRGAWAGPVSELGGQGPEGETGPDPGPAGPEAFGSGGC